MMVLGGNLRGRRVLGEWKALDEPNLYEGRDLAVRTDFRAVLAEVLSSHLGVPSLNKIFPGFAPAPARLRLFAA
jgi:uncharacterized protein (DUF1501 family)